MLANSAEFKEIPQYHLALHFVQRYHITGTGITFADTLNYWFDFRIHMDDIMVFLYFAETASDSILLWMK